MPEATPCCIVQERDCSHLTNFKVDLIKMARKKLLNAGAGYPSARGVLPLFASSDWEEVRLDIDPAVNPNVVGSVTNLRNLCETDSFDAIWSSHILEHLYSHEVPLALNEFYRVLKADGFALSCVPNSSYQLQTI